MGAAAATEPMNGERNIGAVHVNVTVRAQSTECRFIRRPYRWPSRSALQERYAFVLIKTLEINSRGAELHNLRLAIGAPDLQFDGPSVRDGFHGRIIRDDEP